VREERKVVTALFADIVGSTELTTRLDPEDTREILGAAVRLIVSAVADFGGTVKDLAGDGVLALFGAPIAHEDDEERAVRAGLRIVADIAAYGATVERRWHERVEVRVGIDTGLAVLGPVGARDRVEYGAVGDVVNTAARLQAAAPTQTVLVGAGSRRPIESAFAWGPRRELELKGKAGLVSAWQALSAAPVGAESSRSAPPAAPMIARDDALAELGDAIEGAFDGTGAGVFVVGDPGAGKTRLLEEARRGLRDTGHPHRWVVGRCRSYGQSAPLLPIRELMLDRLGVDESASPTVVRERLAVACADRVAPGEAPIEPFLAHLLGLPDDAEGNVVANLPPEAVQRQIFASVAELLAASQQPTIVVVEDLHWADASTVALIAVLLRRCVDRPLAVAVTLRTDPDTLGWRLRGEFVDPPAAEPWIRQVTLDSLAPGADRRLLHALVGADVLPEQLEHDLLRAAEGNPFYLEELVRSLEDAGSLVDVDGHREFDGDVAVAVPPTVERVVLARTDRLDENQYTALTVASAVGRQFSVDLLERLVDPEQLATLDELIRLGLLVASGPDAFEFRHALIQDSVYRSLLKRRRRDLHGQVASAMRSLHDGHVADVARELGRHYSLAEMPTEAVPLLELAVTQARRSYANAEAIDLCRAALDQVAALLAEPSSRASWSQVAVRLEESLGDLCSLTTDYAAAVSAYQRALALLRPDAADEALARARLLTSASGAYAGEADYPAARDALAAAEGELQSRLDDDDVWAMWVDIQLARMNLAYWRNDLDDLRAVEGRLRDELAGRGAPAARAKAHWAFASAANRRTRFLVSDQSLDDARAGFAATEELDDPDALAWAHFHVGFALLWHGDPAPAEAHLAAALAHAVRSGALMLESRSRTYLTVAARLRGDTATARERAALSRSTAVRSAMPEYVAIAIATDAWIEWRGGDAESAERLATSALAGWDPLPMSVPYRWMALWPLLACTHAAGRTAAAVDLARELRKSDQQAVSEGVQAGLLTVVAHADRDDLDGAEAALGAVIVQATALGLL
jgi:class 3 adenylate cyclase